MSDDPKLPNQPVYDHEGVTRFRPNRIVRYLLDAGPFDLNDLAIQGMHSGWTREEQAQFAQLIGYSVGGWSDLSYVTEEKYQSVNESLDAPPQELQDREAFSEGFQAGLERARDLIEMQQLGEFDEI